MPNHLLSITTHPHHHARIIRAFRHATRTLTDGSAHLDRQVRVRHFTENQLGTLEKAFLSLANRHDNNIVILTSGLLNPDLSAKNKDKSVLEIADQRHSSACTIVLASREMPMHGRPSPPFRKMFGLMYEAIFHRKEFGHKHLLSADTTKATIVHVIQKEFFGDAIPSQPMRYISEGAALPFPS